VLRSGAQCLVVVPVDEDSNESSLCALAFRPHVTAQALVAPSKQRRSISIRDRRRRVAKGPCSGARGLLAEGLPLADAPSRKPSKRRMRAFAARIVPSAATATAATTLLDSSPGSTSAPAGNIVCEFFASASIFSAIRRAQDVSTG
jgi:hypothetical protein